ncbi:MAG: MBL fold metallo-hydrolase [Proteobacteria bacterium]|nr:MBL fold metallo-hydrolase [Pseudomonadota bacterium]
MSVPLYRSRPGGFDIKPASRPEALRVHDGRVHDGIWLSEGLSNAYLVVTRAGRVVINTGMGFEAPVHKRNFDAVDGGPVRYILLTQGHVDHVGGVDLLRGPDTEIVAQAGNPAHQADDARIARFRAARSGFAFARAIGEAARTMREKIGGPVPTQSVPEPTITFEDRTRFELGGVRFELLATPGGETADSMVVWLPDERVCFTGNLFSALFGHFPNLVTIRGDRYREALRFIESLERVLALEPELLLVGHHQPVSGSSLIRSELERLRGAVQYVHDETVRGMNAGTDVHELMRDIRLPRELEVGQGYGKVSWSVRAIWETYAGWFHHRSTTELYPVPASSVHGDLVELAGGPDAVAKRAREKLDAGAPLEAIHLAEVALGAVPGHRGSLGASIDAHEQLLAESENFWETSWLRKQVGELRSLVESRPEEGAG